MVGASSGAPCWAPIGHALRYCAIAPARPGSRVFVRSSAAVLRFTLKTREKRPPAFAARAADAQKMLAVQKDPRFLELQAALRAEPAEPRGRQMHRGAQTARPNVMGSLDETKASWKLHFYGGLRMLIETVNMSLDPRMAEKQLDEAYRWYLASKQLGKDAARTERTERHLPMAALGPDFHDFCAEEVLRNPAQPGSAYYESAGEAIHEADPISSPSEKLEETLGAD
eukprot:Skav200864  [mRNA]  locus=scaffold3214:117092:118356:- [translate_table: standard]